MAKQTETQPELRRQSRAELIEIIYAMQQEEAKRTAAQAAQIAALEDESKALQAKLDDRTLTMAQSGDIAQAALGLHHIFQDAQAAADQYVQSVRAKALADADLEAGALLAETRQKCDAMLAEAGAEVDAKWEQFRLRVLHIVQTTPELKNKLDEKHPTETFPHL